MDLRRVTDDLKDLERRLEAQTRPVRARLDSLGPVGLYAVAAEEQRAADLAHDEGRRRLHHAAAIAAQALADRAAREPQPRAR
jgi:hypothetical protein